MKTKVGLVFGGRSGEHEVSVRSAGNVACAFNKEKYEIVPIAISIDGEWLGPAESVKVLSEEAQAAIGRDFEELKGRRVGLKFESGSKGFSLSSSGGSDEPLSVDVAFPALHGTFGEDGTIQGMLEMAGIPFVGCGVLASACGMDKVVMKSLFSEAGLPMCRYVWFLRSEWEADSDLVAKHVERTLGFPCFVKPANLGSSVGISKAADTDSLKDAISHAAEYDSKVIVEECLTMREIECAILGNDKPEASLPGEYLIRNKTKTFLDYTEKYSATGNNEFVVPSPVSEELAGKIREMAVTAFKAIDGSGLARVDFFLRSDNGALLVNEINTMPGLTDASGYPKMWEGSGVPFAEVLDRLIALATERSAERSSNRTK
ncbi:MAG: D-alanine--D-alanine ligase [Acidobacteria bacterium]|nr:D-alanine--D-alanine ligase [Acidobacteriota bacterium]